jgi:tRNA pseudouridine38-40 synthase
MSRPIKYKITIQYDGTNYSGWQVQPNAPTIQETLKKTLEKFLREDVWIAGSGRTDAGVHALEQVAHFTVSKEIDARRFMAAANGLLPPDIRILEISEADEDFHARYSAKGKIYHYHLWLEKVRSPMHRLYTTYYAEPLDQGLLKEAAAKFIGKHDFTSFANSATEGSAAKNAVRTIRRIDIVQQEGGLRLEFEADGFLYKMVRNIVGMLLDVASGKRPLEDIDKAFEKKDRRFASKAAPPTGLFLVKVIY